MLLAIRQVSVLFISLVCLGLCHPTVYGQRQMVVLKRGETVVARFQEGQMFTYQPVDSREAVRTYILRFTDTAIITPYDTVPLRSIRRLYFKQYSFRRTVGTALLTAGIGHWLIDWLQYATASGADPGVNRFSLTTVALGAPLVLIRKKSQQLWSIYRPIIIDPSSHLYLPDHSTEKSLY